MRFMVMVKATKDSEAGKMPSEELLAAMAKFNEEMVKAGVMLDGNGLQPSSKGARVRFSGDKRTVIDGPFAETKELVAGYWVLQVKSKQEAIEWIKRCPNPMNEDSDIEIRQIFELEDFGASEAVEHHRTRQGCERRAGQNDLTAANTRPDDHGRRRRDCGLDEDRPFLGKSDRGDSAVLHARQLDGLGRRQEARLAHVQVAAHDAVDVRAGRGEHHARRVARLTLAPAGHGHAVRGDVKPDVVLRAESGGIGQLRVDRCHQNAVHWRRRTGPVGKRGHNHGREQGRVVLSHNRGEFAQHARHRVTDHAPQVSPQGAPLTVVTVTGAPAWGEATT